MKFDMDYKDAVGELQKDVEQLLSKTDENVAGCLKDIGQIVATETSRTAVRSNNEYYWSKGEKRKNTHIADDVEYKVKKARRTKTPYVSISGGKKTWPKWILANDGHVAKNGRFVPGNHFVDKSAKASEEKVDSIIDKFLREVVN